MIFKQFIQTLTLLSVKALSLFSICFLMLCLSPSHRAEAQTRAYRLPPGIVQTDYAKGVIVVKLKSNPANSKAATPSIQQLSKSINAHKYEQAIDQKLAVYHSKSIQNGFDLSQIYKIYIGHDQELVPAINRLLQEENVVYAEPYFLAQPLFIPNDPEAKTSGSQNYLAIIDAYDAWEFEKGDSSVVIGVLDTGVDLTHEDLASNIAFNEDDPINGLDDDNDGYIDNYQGWDFANQDNDPTADLSQHGTSVTGISAARTNNGLGIAGLGYNSKFLPIKIFDSESNSFGSGYEAILYAAIQGCQVINLSWGSPGTFSNFAQDVINKAVIDYDAVIVAAAGNTNANLTFYPASYENVLSVGASNNTDQKAGFATYSHFIDLMAPGSSQYTTKNGSAYGFSTGSSFSSPMVAGVAALVRARYPDLNARQVMEKLRLSSDDIYGIAGNESFIEQLGKGRLNAQRAVAPYNQPALRMTNLSFANKIGPYAIGGDTISLTMDFVNYLNATSNAKVTLSSTSPYATTINDEFEIGQLISMDSLNNASDPFQIFLDPNTPANTRVEFRLGFQDGTYADYQYFEIEVNPAHIDLDNGKILISIDSDGDLSYINNNLSIGSGFNFNGQKILDHIGLAVGSQPTMLVDNVIQNLNSGEKNNDFNALSSLKFQQNAYFPIDIRSTFDDVFASNPVNIKVDQSILTSDVDEDNNYLILEYRITNLGTGSIADLFTGIYTDWDIDTYTANKSEWDNDNKLGYIYNTVSQNQFAGLALISDQNTIFNAIDLANENGNSADFSNALSKTDKFGLISSNTKSEAGSIGLGNDVAQFVSGQFSNLNQNQSFKIAFVLAVENTLDDLKATVQKAKSLYSIHVQNPVISQTIYVCEGETTTVNPDNGTNFRFYQHADTTGFLGEFEAYPTGPITEDLSLYIVNSDSPDLGDIQRLDVVIKDPEANFSTSKDTVFIDESNDTNIIFTDLSKEAISWDWSFQNGFTSTSQNPSVNFTEKGVYNVSMQITTSTGCTDMAQKEVVVVNRGPMPSISNIMSCPGVTVDINAGNADNLAMYLDEGLNEFVQLSSDFSLQNILTDTTFYITNRDSIYESLPTAVHIDVNEISADYSFSLDTTTITNPATMNIIANDNNATSWLWYFNNEVTSNENNVNYMLTGEMDLEVKLVVENNNGCLDSLVQIIEIGPSTTPEDQEIRVCLGKHITFNPPGNGIHNFYEDINRENLIHRGRVLDLGQLEESQELFYTNLDNYLDSEPASLSIEVIDDYTSFELPQETIFLNTGNEIEFSDSSPHVVNRQWYIDGQITSTDSTFNHLFDASGNYTIRLVTENDIGCVDDLVKNLKILLVTGISGANSIQNEITVFPNPAYDEIQLKVSDPVINETEIILFNSIGQVARRWQRKDLFTSMKLNLEGLAPGTYFIEVSSQRNKYTKQKLIIN